MFCVFGEYLDKFVMLFLTEKQPTKQLFFFSDVIFLIRWIFKSTNSSDVSNYVLCIYITWVFPFYATLFDILESNTERFTALHLFKSHS